MKFGKRFAQAQGEYEGNYLSYKALKQALKRDCLGKDALGGQFEQVCPVYGCAVPAAARL